MVLSATRPQISTTPNRFNPTYKDIALGGALASSAYYRAGSPNAEFDARVKGFTARFTTGAGFTQTLFAPLLMMGVMGAVRPVTALLVGGINNYLLSLAITSLAMSSASTGVMTGINLLKSGGLPEGTSFAKQWLTGVAYSAPAMALGMGMGQTFGLGIGLLSDVAVLEPMQAVASMGVSKTLSFLGIEPKTTLTLKQQFLTEMMDGIAMLGVGRMVGGATIQLRGTLEQGARYLTGNTPEQRAAFERAWERNPSEVGAVGDRKPRKRLNASEKSAKELSGILRKNRRAGLNRNRVPFVSTTELEVKRVSDGVVGTHPIIDGDTLHVWVEGLDHSVPIRFMQVNSVEAAKGSGHPEVRNGKGELGALEAYFFLHDLSKIHNDRMKARLFRQDPHKRPVVSAFVRAKQGKWLLDINRAMIESANAHVYIIEPQITGKAGRFLDIQLEMQRDRLGMWQYPQYQTGLHITSIRTLPESDKRGGYIRVFNTGDKDTNLGGYRIKNGSMNVTLPNFPLRRGQGVQVFLNGTSYNDNSNKELTMTVEFPKGDKRSPDNLPKLNYDYPVELISPTKQTIFVHVPSEGARQHVKDPRFQVRRAEGVHLMSFNPLYHMKGLGDPHENVRLYNYSAEEKNVSGWKLKNGRRVVALPEGTVIPPFRAIQVFTGNGKTTFDIDRDMRLYLGVTKGKQRIWKNTNPMELIRPDDVIISKEANNAKAKKKIEAHYLKRRGALLLPTI